MIAEGFPSFSGCAVGGLWALTHEFLALLDISDFLQSGGMARQVAVGHLQDFSQLLEFSPFLYYQDRHDSKSDPVFELPINMGDDVFQRS